MNSPHCKISKMNLLTLAAICLLISGAVGREVCFESLGCFTDAAPFGSTIYRPIPLLPDTPQKIATKFTLYRRDLGENGVSARHDNLPEAFDPASKTVMIIHGFFSTSVPVWMIEMKNAILQVEDVNVVIVDWTKGNQFPYIQAVANTQVVGAEVARFIGSAISTRGFNSGNFHLIGHSLGAHIAGYAGSRVRTLGRITGLDPAGPYFEFTNPIVRLDPSDAFFVDAIHTDGAATVHLGFGLMQAVGHVDYYPNGGKAQPECKATSDKLLGAINSLVALDMSGAEEAVMCNHVAAQAYFIDTIKNNNCRYNAFQCKSKDEFDKGNCLVCSSKGCNQMGYWSSPNREQGTLYLNTLSPNKDAYCTQSFTVKLTSSRSNSLAKGKFRVYLKTASQVSDVLAFDQVFIAGQADTRLLTLGEIKMTEAIESVFVSYSRAEELISFLYASKWNFNSVEVFSGDDQESSKFCPSSDKVGSEFVEFKRC